MVLAETGGFRHSGARYAGRDAAAAIVAGWAADRLFGDPPRWHPVAGFGRLAAAAERRTWRPSRLAGAAYVAALVGTATALAAVAERVLEGRRGAQFLVRAAGVWITLGGRSLERAAIALDGHVAAGELEAARALAPTLVGRDPARLDGPELCRAAVESVAENTSDAVVAPLLWAAVRGLPGVVGYRAANTLDAMVGHRGERYGRFGWAAARLDDVLNWPAARLTALIVIAATPLVGGRPQDAWRAAFIDGAAHPSPNAGLVEGAFAGALALRLGGLNRYSHGVERRPDLGGGAAPGAGDVARAVGLSRVVSAAAAALAALLAWGRCR